jgi:hypothetical protein
MFLLSKSSYVLRTVPKKGRAVFALRDIPAGTIIGDYVGVVKRIDEEDEIKTGLYTIGLTEKTDVLADPKKVGIHLINHSCMPNCGMAPVAEGHTVYVAVRRIFNGEELTVDYLMSPPDDETTLCPHTCHCGTLFCRGTMHTSFRISEEWDDYYKKKQKRYYRARLGTYGAELAPLSKYPKQISDNSLWDIFANPKKKAVIVRGAKLPSQKKTRELLRVHGAPVRFVPLGLEVTGVLSGRIIGKRIP